jgi:hypothetical protein
VKAFAQIIKRSTSLNHLSQAARAVWQNEIQVNQMKDDWSLIDFKTVHEQAVFVCGCDENLLAVGKLFSSSIFSPLLPSSPLFSPPLPFLS